MMHHPPAGWVYVAWHPKSPGFTKIGYSKSHPTDSDENYTFKRVHQISRYLVSFGFGSLETWVSEFHPSARILEAAAQRELIAARRPDVLPSTDIFDVDPAQAIEVVSRLFGQTKP
jgi:hypothetical protein